MKKVLLLLSALLMTVALAGCSFEELVEKIDLDAIADLVLEMSKTELEDVKNAEQIKQDLPQELAGITGKRLDIAALTFSIERIEGQRTLARAADAGNNDKLIARNVNAYIL